MFSEAEMRRALAPAKPNPLVGAIHPKAMPVILDEADYAVWLHASFDEACALAKPYPSQLMALQSD
jgi:putative SOS response-associated peptidase YedK